MNFKFLKTRFMLVFVVGILFLLINNFYLLANDKSNVSKAHTNTNINNTNNSSTILIANNINDISLLIKDSLLNFESKLILKLPTNISLNNANFIKDVIDENPDIDYGFSSANYKLVRSKKLDCKYLTIDFKYKFTLKKMLTMKNLSEEKSKNILKNLLKENLSQSEKELLIHDYIVNNTKFQMKKSDMEASTAYGVLINGLGTCEGYSKAFYLLLKKAGIHSSIVKGKVKISSKYVNHMWNCVTINNTNYYVDVTWDDPVISKSSTNSITHKYFNITTEQIAKDHFFSK